MEQKYKISKIFKALSDPTRLEIIRLLAIKPHCVCELANIIGFSQPTISKHLKVLTEAGIINYTKSKFFVIYQLSPKDEFIAKILKNLLEVMKEQSLTTSSLDKKINF